MPPYAFKRLPSLPANPAPGAPRYVVERSTLTSPLYSFRFTVAGRGAFPLDMLRYEQCYPRDGTSAANLDDHSQREVDLQAEHRQPYWQPTFERWRSFGWVVKTDVEGGK